TTETVLSFSFETNNSPAGDVVDENMAKNPTPTMQTKRAPQANFIGIALPPHRKLHMNHFLH
ncbi:MAG: hypothetical protein AB7S70_12865, partial [Hyphomicrobium sp.]